MITAHEAAEKWGVSFRRVQELCKRGAIEGAVLWHRSWMIPDEAKYPKSSKLKAVPDVSNDMPLPRKTVFLDMTDIYHTPGCALESARTLEYNMEARILFEAEIEYARGEIDRVYEKASYLLEKHSGFYAVLAGGMLLGFCAIWRGDIGLWERAKRHICEAPFKTDNDREIISLTLAALDSSIYSMDSFPEWFQMGNFEPLHPDSLPAAKVFYAKYLYVTGYAVASKQYKMEGVQGLSLMSMLPNTIEPMISQAVADKTVVAELYLRLICAEAYHNSGNDKQAIRHIDRAIALSVPDSLLGILVEHRKALDTLLDERIKVHCPELLDRIKELGRDYSIGWAALSGAVRNRRISTNLTSREREVSKLAAFGMSNAEIAEKLHISVPSVKQAIRLSCAKGGVDSRDELITIL